MAEQRYISYEAGHNVIRLDYSSLSQTSCKHPILHVPVLTSCTSIYDQIEVDAVCSRLSFGGTKDK